MASARVSVATQPKGQERVCDAMNKKTGAKKNRATKPNTSKFAHAQRAAVKPPAKTLAEASIKVARYKRDIEEPVTTTKKRTAADAVGSRSSGTKPKAPLNKVPFSESDLAKRKKINSRAADKKRGFATSTSSVRSRKLRDPSDERKAQNIPPVGQVAVALPTIVDIARRKLNSNFDLALGLTKAKSFGEIMELHAAYWRKQFGVLEPRSAETAGKDL